MVLQGWRRLGGSPVTTFAQLRKAALSLPETEEEGRGSGAVAFRVHGEQFAATGGDNDACLHLSDDAAAEFLGAYPSAERLDQGGRRDGVRILLGDIDGQQLNHWVRRAWLSQAPERLVEQAAAADSVTVGGVGDLPRGIGRPATQALMSAGVTTLAEVAEFTEAELRAMHGVGPKAVSVLREALVANGSSFRS
jgi:hypothetical protein